MSVFFLTFLIIVFVFVVVDPDFQNGGNWGHLENKTHSFIIVMVVRDCYSELTSGHTGERTSGLCY